MTEKLYTPENCKLVGEWLARALGECKATSVGEYLSDPNLPWDSSMLTPELIREALVKDGLSVYQNYDRPMLELREIDGGDTAVFFDKNWNDTDPTFRHRLFAATVEYLEGKK